MAHTGLFYHIVIFFGWRPILTILRQGAVIISKINFIHKN